MKRTGIHKQMLVRRGAIAGALLAMAFAADTADAASCTASATGVSFNIYDPTLGTDNDSTGSISVQCTGLLETVNYSVSLSTGSSNTYTSKLLKAGAQQLNYNLYTQSARTAAQIWGDTTGGSVRMSGTLIFIIILTPTTQTDTLTIYGRIPAGQDVGPGSYTDSITVTVAY